VSSVSIRFSDDLEARLDDEARRAGKKRSEVVREAVAEYITRREHARMLAAMATELRGAAPAMRTDERKIADEFLAAENEAAFAAETAAPDAANPDQGAPPWWT